MPEAEHQLCRRKKQGGRSSSDIGRAGGGVKLQPDLAVFGIFWEKGTPLLASVHQFPIEWTHWVPVACPKGRDEGKNIQLLPPFLS